MGRNGDRNDWHDGRQRLQRRVGRRDSLELSRARPDAFRPAGRVLRRSGRHAGAAVSRLGDGRLSLPSQRQHALALSDERRDRRADRELATGARRFRERASRRDRVRPEHDDAHLPPRARSRARVGDWATRSSSPSSITTATSRPGVRWKKTAASPCARYACAPKTVDSTGAHSKRPSRPRPSCSRSAPRRTRSARSPTSRAPRQLAHAVGARVFVDAVHYAPHNLVDVEALGCDFLGCSAYKFYGPHIGILWGRRAIIESLDAPRLEPGAAGIARATGDGHAESRRDRRRRGGGRFPRVARRRTVTHAPRRTSHDASTPCTRAANSCSPNSGIRSPRSTG